MAFTARPGGDGTVLVAGQTGQREEQFGPLLTLLPALCSAHDSGPDVVALRPVGRELTVLKHKPDASRILGDSRHVDVVDDGAQVEGEGPDDGGQER